MKKILVVSPHPDDEVLGCAGAILDHNKNKDKVFWLIMTGIDNSAGWSKSKIIKRESEIKKINKFFKFEKVFNLNYPTTLLDKIDSVDIINQIKNILSLVKPNIIYLPFINDPHSDHRITTESFNSCIKPFRHNYIDKVLMYETLSETNLNFLSDRQFNPNYFIDISKNIKKKLNAMKIYESEIGTHPFPRSEESIYSLAKLRGSQVNLNFAEAFELVYEIKKNK